MWISLRKRWEGGERVPAGLNQKCIRAAPPALPGWQCGPFTVISRRLMLLRLGLALLEATRPSWKRMSALPFPPPPPAHLTGPLEPPLHWSGSPRSPGPLPALWAKLLDPSAALVSSLPLQRYSAPRCQATAHWLPSHLCYSILICIKDSPFADTPLPLVQRPLLTLQILCGDLGHFHLGVPQEPSIQSRQKSYPCLPSPPSPPRTVKAMDTNLSFCLPSSGHGAIILPLTRPRVSIPFQASTSLNPPVSHPRPTNLNSLSQCHILALPPYLSPRFQL